MPTDVYDLTAPIGGLNTRDPISRMPETDALELINLFPRTSDVVLRSGSSIASTLPTSDAIETLAELARPDGTYRLVAAQGDALVDATSSIGVNFTTGFSNARWQHEQFNGRLFLVNGADAPRDYNGTSLATTAWSGTGLTNSDLIDVCKHRSRLYFVEKESSHLWYGATNGITGTLTKFSVEGLINGAIFTVASWSRVNGAGDTAQLVIVSTEGDVLIYDGSDPGSDFSLARKFTIPQLLSRKCLVPFGSDLIAITRSKIAPLSVFMEGRLEAFTFWDKMDTRFIEYVEQYGNNYGWSGIYYQDKRQLIVNVPTSASDSFQIVYNTQTGAPCIFEGQGGLSLTIYNRKPHIGNSRSPASLVLELDDGTQDWNNAPIPFRMRSAFVRLSGAKNLKSISRIKPIIEVSDDITIDYHVDTDYRENRSDKYPYDLEREIGATWGGAWGLPWTAENTVSDAWAASQGEGHTVSVGYRGETRTATVRFVATRLHYEIGGTL